MGEEGITISVSAKSSHIGQIEFSSVKYPLPPLCACCGAREGLRANTLQVLVDRYRPGLYLGYALCPACHARKASDDARFGVAALSGAAAALGLLTWMFLKPRWGLSNPFLIIGIALAAGIVLGIVLGLLLRRKPFGPPHTSCAHAVSANAVFKGSEGAFGVWQGSGSVYIRWTCRHPEFERALREALAPYRRS